MGVVVRVVIMLVIPIGVIKLKIPSIDVAIYVSSPPSPASWIWRHASSLSRPSLMILSAILVLLHVVVSWIIQRITSIPSLVLILVLVVVLLKSSLASLLPVAVGAWRPHSRGRARERKRQQSRRLIGRSVNISRCQIRRISRIWDWRVGFGVVL